jgi:hypothetical protein
VVGRERERKRNGMEWKSSTEGDDVGHLEWVALDAIEDVDLLEHELDGFLLELFVVVVHNVVHQAIVLLLLHDTTRQKTHHLHECATKSVLEGGLVCVLGGTCGG